VIEEMAAQIIGILNQFSAAHPSIKAHPAKSLATTMAGNSEGDSATISANDFLTLLVTEMKNQDPTANTDPNEYINQLVQVNSLQQLISINQTLTTDSTANPASPDIRAETAHPVSSGHAPAHLANGNLTVPVDNPAAQHVAESLTTRFNRS
jgi:flagellar basal-body rod modification protein FlgD